MTKNSEFNKNNIIRLFRTGWSWKSISEVVNIDISLFKSLYYRHLKIENLPPKMKNTKNIITGPQAPGIKSK